MRVFHDGHGTRPQRMAAYREALDELAPCYRRVDSPAHADIVFYTEPGWNKFRAWTTTLRSDEVIRAYPEKCFVYEFSDRPVGFLAGLYVNRTRSKIDWMRMRPADYWTSIPASDERALLNRQDEPTLLFSFRGKANAGVRSRILELDLRGIPAQVRETFRWHDFGSMESDDDRRAFLEEMRGSHFVLCPRGLAPSTFRVYEAMQLGRVPVILSDDWEPTPGIPWPDFSIKVAEDRVGELPDILDRHRADASEMGRLAREAWERWMRPGPTLFGRWLRAIEEILETRPADWRESGQHRRWRSHRFRWENEIHPAQGAAARTRRLLSAAHRPGSH